jgi:hypothetical protein
MMVASRTGRSFLQLRTCTGKYRCRRHALVITTSIHTFIPFARQIATVCRNFSAVPNLVGVPFEPIS